MDHAKGFRKLIGKRNKKPAYFYWPKDEGESSAKVRAWIKMKEWDGICERQPGFADWDKVVPSAIIAKNLPVGSPVAVPYATIKATALALPEGKEPLTVDEMKTAYLDDRKRHIDLMGSLGIAQHTYDITAYRINRAIGFLPSEVRSSPLKELDGDILKNCIMAIAALPEGISQSTGMAFINALKQMMIWAEHQESFDYRTPKQFKNIFSIRPEPEEQTHTVLPNETMKTLINGCKNKNARTKDKGEKRKLFIMMGLNFGSYQNDIASLEHSHILTDEKTGESFVWRLRKKTRKTNRKLQRVKFYIWPETMALITKYQATKKQPLVLLTEDGKPLMHGRTNNITLAFRRLCESTLTDGVAFSHFRDTGADWMERHGGAELSAMYLQHSRSAVAEAYNSVNHDRLTTALKAWREQLVKGGVIG
jgi:integrase